MIRIWLIVTFLLLNLSCIPSSDVSLSAIKKKVVGFTKKLNFRWITISFYCIFFIYQFINSFLLGGYYDISNSTIVITPSLPRSCIHNHLLPTSNSRAKMFIRIWRHASSLIHIKFTSNSREIRLDLTLCTNFQCKFHVK